MDKPICFDLHCPHCAERVTANPRWAWTPRCHFRCPKRGR